MNDAHDCFHLQDTTAGAMASMCYYMAKRPDIQQRARAEVREAMAKNTSGEPTMEELKNMPFLQACIRESLRTNCPIVRVFLGGRRPMRLAVANCFIKPLSD